MIFGYRSQTDNMREVEVLCYFHGDTQIYKCTITKIKSQAHFLINTGSKTSESVLKEMAMTGYKQQQKTTKLLQLNVFMALQEQHSNNS